MYIFHFEDSMLSSGVVSDILFCINSEIILLLFISHSNTFWCTEIAALCDLCHPPGFGTWAKNTCRQHQWTGLKLPPSSRCHWKHKYQPILDFTEGQAPEIMLSYILPFLFIPYNKWESVNCGELIGKHQVITRIFCKASKDGIEWIPQFRPSMFSILL